MEHKIIKSKQSSIPKYLTLLLASCFLIFSFAEQTFAQNSKKELKNNNLKKEKSLQKEKDKKKNKQNSQLASYYKSNQVGRIVFSKNSKSPKYTSGLRSDFAKTKKESIYTLKHPQTPAINRHVVQSNSIHTREGLNLIRNKDRDFISNSNQPDNKLYSQMDAGTIPPRGEPPTETEHPKPPIDQYPSERSILMESTVNNTIYPNLDMQYSGVRMMYGNYFNSLKEVYQGDDVELIYNYPNNDNQELTIYCDQDAFNITKYNVLPNGYEIGFNPVKEGLYLIGCKTDHEHISNGITHSLLRVLSPDDVYDPNIEQGSFIISELYLEQNGFKYTYDAEKEAAHNPSIISMNCAVEPNGLIVGLGKTVDILFGNIGPNADANLRLINPDKTEGRFKILSPEGVSGMQSSMYVPVGETGIIEFKVSQRGVYEIVNDASLPAELKASYRIYVQ